MVDVSDFIKARRTSKQQRDRSTKSPPADPNRAYSYVSSEPKEGLSRQTPDLTDITVRRPGYGVTPPTPNWALLEVTSLQGNQPVEIFNSCYPGGVAPGTTNFILNSIRYAPQESVQIARTFGDWYLADLGEAPDMVHVTCTLLEAPNFPWLREWQQNWGQFLRARRCIINRAMVSLTIDQVTYNGYLVSSEVSRAHSFQSSWKVQQMVFSMLLRSVEDNTVEGVKVGFASDGGDDKSPLQKYYEDQYESDPTFTGSSTNAALRALGLEIIAGDPQNSFQWIPAVLEDPQTEEELRWAININRLTALARSVNAAANREVLDIGDVRRGLISEQNATLSNRASNSPYGTATNQRAYRDKTSRQIENGMDRTVGASSRKVKDFLF